MTRPSITSTFLALTIVSVLASCSSDDDDPIVTPMQPDNMVGTGGGMNGGSDMNPGTPTVDLATTPVFMTTTCDAAPAPVDTATSSVATAPAQMLPNTLVSGRLNPDSTTNTEHYWFVELQAGIYHFIMENQISTGNRSNIGLMVESTDALGEPLETLIRSNQVDNRIRVLNTLTLESATTLRLKVTPVFNQEDYLMGIFSNGTPVASPYFSDCPTIGTLALGTTEAFLLDASAAMVDNEVWFETTLDVADYTLTASASVVGGANTNIIYSAVSSDQFGQISRATTVFGTNAVDTMFDTSGILQPADAGLHWIRFRNINTPLNISTTLTQN